ncbi:MAG: tail fiber domain-containing protein [Verrucomicrobiota bacterium]
MKIKSAFPSFALALLTLTTISSQLSTSQAQGTAFTYQGRLNSGANPASGSFDLMFTLFDTNTAGAIVAGPITNRAVAVSDGLFTTAVDFGAGVLIGGTNWLEVAVRPGGASSFNTLAPRQQLTPTPYAVTAENLAGVTEFNSIVPGENATVSGGDANTASFYFATVAGGQLNTASGIQATVGGGDNNEATGNSATVAGGQSGSSSGEYSTIGGGDDNLSSSNFTTVAGGWDNTASGYAATVGGGYENTATATFTTVAGGADNTATAYGSAVGGGVYNTASSPDGSATVSGGYENTASGDSSSVGGGYDDTATGPYSTIAGGNQNSASGTDSFLGGGLGNTNTSTYGTLCGGAYNYCWINGYETILGGSHNYCSGDHATIVGGAGNLAAGVYSLAAGFQAQVVNNGSFVWSDDSGATTVSTANNQFMARASGGVVFYTGTGSGGAQLAAGATSWTAISDRNAKKNFQPVDTGAVLDKLAAIPIEQWNYKWEKDTDVPNIGPMAQDFKHAFYPGRDDKGISTLEFDGVELAAIQGLNQKVAEKAAEIESLKQRNDSLAERLNGLEALVKSIAASK